MAAHGQTAGPGRLGRYELRGLLGRGAMGEVYRAHDPLLDRDIALKVLPVVEDASTPIDHQKRLMQEGRAMARIHHPNVASVLDVGLSDGQLFVAMELVEGGDLAAWIRDGRGSGRQVLPLLLQAAEGLAAAHAEGFVHRDFKPSNVLVDGRTAKVADFGIVGCLAGPTEAGGLDREGSALDAPVSILDRTLTGTRLGTPAYMAPEQARGERADARADQFAFCLVLYEAWTAKRACTGSNAAQLFIEKEELARVVGRDLSLPRRLRRVLSRGLQVDPDERYPDMNDLIADLRRVDRRSSVSHWFATTAGLVGLLWASAPSTPAAAETAKTPAPMALPSDSRQDCLARGAAMRDAAKAISATEAAALGDEVYWCAWSEGLDALAYDAAKHVTFHALSRSDRRRAHPWLQRARLADGRLEPNPTRTARLAEAAAMLRALDGELEEAVEDLDTLSRTLNHDDAVYADVEVALVVTLLNAGRADQALERLLKLEEVTADDPHRRVATDDARALLGSSLASMGRFEDAQTVLTPFVPTLAEQPAAIRESAHFTLGEIDQASGRLESAIAHYEASVEAAQQMRPSLRRGQAECAVQIAVCLRTLGRRGEASARLESALRERRDEGLPLDATDGSLAYGLGEGYLTDEDLPRAREAYELALAATAPTVPADHPRLIPARTGLLRVAVIQQDFDGARKHMAHIRATRLSSFSPAVLSMIDFLEAQILWESGDDRPRAVQLARRALQTLREEPGRQGGNVPLIERWIEART